MTNWAKYLSAKRPHDNKEEAPEFARSAFQRDFDRIVFSSAFRRLQDKTQVHPFPDTDYVRKRLTHSIEVSCVARSLGTYIGSNLKERGVDLGGIDEPAAQIGQITAAAALAHDIGNPPFGHVGEAAIAHWFIDNASIINDLSEVQKADLQKFEGNAQGFRILSRSGNNGVGLKLTAATLGAFTKYPVNSINRSKVYAGHKKHGFVDADITLFRAIADATGLVPDGSHAWKRHPLAFLVEAADDICYKIIDVEDGEKLRRITFEQAEDCLIAFLPDTSAYVRGAGRRDANLGWLRARAIGQLIESAKLAFIQNEEKILNGSFNGSLLDVIPEASAMAQAKALVHEHVFSWDRIVKAEIAGTNMLRKLLSDIMEAVAAPEKGIHKKVLSLVPDYPMDGDLYDRCLAVTDFLSGMTDSYLLQTFNQVHGSSLRG